MVKNKMGFGTGSYLTGIYQAQMTHTLYSNLKFISSFTDLSQTCLSKMIDFPLSGGFVCVCLRNE